MPRARPVAAKFLGYTEQNPKTRYDLWVLPLQGDRKPFPFLQTEFNELRCQFSPDGRWLAYSSDETSRYEIYVRPFAGAPAGSGGKWQVSINGGSLPRWRRDGKELFYVAPDRKLMAVEVKANSGSFQAGVPKPLFDTRTDPSIGSRGGYDVSPDGRRFLISAPGEQPSASPIHVVVNWAASRRN